MAEDGQLTMTMDGRDNTPDRAENASLQHPEIRSILLELCTLASSSTQGRRAANGINVVLLDELDVALQSGSQWCVHEVALIVGVACCACPSRSAAKRVAVQVIGSPP